MFCCFTPKLEHFMSQFRRFFPKLGRFAFELVH